MAKSTGRFNDPPESPTTVPRTQSSQPRQRTPVEADELLELLGDEYTHRVLEAVVEKPRTGREIIDAADVSKATVYRRLEKLEEANLVDSRMNLDEDGHHCKQFQATVESIRVGFDDDGFTVNIEPDVTGADGESHGTYQPLADD